MERAISGRTETDREPARSNHVTLKEVRPVTATQATADVFVTAFRALPKGQRKAVLERLLRDRETLKTFVRLRDVVTETLLCDQDLREDLIDLALIEQRQNEPTRTLEKYLPGRRKKQR